MTQADAESAAALAADDEDRRMTGRRLPRDLSEAGPLIAATALGVFGAEQLARRERIIADHGGDENVSEARRLLIGQAVDALAVVDALKAEIGLKASKSRRAGHTPCPSQYQATRIVSAQSSRRNPLVSGHDRAAHVRARATDRSPLRPARDLPRAEGLRTQLRFLATWT
jgi:hypothetical protein